MIIDKIKNLEEYSYVTGIDKVIEFLAREDILTIENGKYELGDGSTVKVSSYETKEEDEEVLLEAHREFLDVQIALSGRELLYFQAIDLGEEAISYDNKKDVEFFTAPWYNSVVLGEDNFAIIFPNDLHVGGLDTLGGKSKIKKLVFKLKING